MEPVAPCLLSAVHMYIDRSTIIPGGSEPRDSTTAETSRLFTISLMWMLKRLLGCMLTVRCPATPAGPNSVNLTSALVGLGFCTSTHSSKPGRVVPSGRYQ